MCPIIYELPVWCEVCQHWYTDESPDVGDC